MATKIKAVKCPQCGSEKHEQIDEKRFRCKSCGTEFYIDDDDININVNHHYEYQAAPESPFGKYINTGAKIGFIALLAPVAFILILFYSALRSDYSSSNPITGTTKDSIGVRDNYEHLSMMVHDGKPCFFYLADRDYSTDYGEENPKYVSGYYFGFRDATSGQVLAERLFISENDLRDRNISMTTSTPKIRYFYQAHRWFLTITKHFVYEINPNTLSIKNVSQSLFKGKDAMSTGISSIEFLNEDCGEGFEVHNNLAETYFYFPATNRLYTEEAYRYARELSPSQLNGEIRDTTYLDLQQENMSDATRNGGRLRIWKIHAKFHNGDPQDFGFYNWIRKSYGPVRGDRLVSARPITNWFTGFSSKILYRDAHYILITFRPTISGDANSVFQLRDMNGNIIWTQALDKFSSVSDAILCGNKFWIWGRRDRSTGYDEIRAYSFNVKEGKYERKTVIPNEYSIKTK